MSSQVQIRRDTAANVLAMTPAQGEMIGDTTNNRVCVGDGTTAGGWPAAKLAEVPAMARGFVNKFRNGGFNVAQRGTSGSVATSTAGIYTLDGWMVAATGASAPWAQEYAANTAGHALRLTAASGLTAVTLRQRIESFVAAQLMTTAGGVQPVTVQYAIYNNSGGALTAQLATAIPTAQDSFGTVTADLAATNFATIANGTLAVVALTFTPSATVKNGYQVDLLLGGALNGTGGGYVDVARADIRATPALAAGLPGTAQPIPVPELRPFGVELEYCQRYFCKTFPQATAPAQATGVYGGALAYRAQYTGADYCGATWRFPVTMRAAPTVTYFNPASANANWRNTSTSADSGTTAATGIATSDGQLFPLNLQISGDNAGNIIVIHATASAEL